jgi:predicted nucleic acid-binding protein/ribosomal protein S18 acetylase RimI-like enzyme
MVNEKSYGSVEIKVFNILEELSLLQNVIELGDSNNSTLGFFPKTAFSDAAKKGKIIVATTYTGKCIGYLLFRLVKTKYKVSITHLCVDNNYRHQGVGKKLLNYLIQNTQEWRGISLYCRRDYESNAFWSNNGFKFVAEKEGRGFDQKPLSYYWYEYHHDNLLSLENQYLLNSKNYRAVIDMNVFVMLFENNNHALNANWLREEIIFSISDEINNEINRDNDSSRRKYMLNFTQNFPCIKTDLVNVKNIYSHLEKFFPARTIQDKSDLLQLSHAIESKSNFFVTKDLSIRNKLKDISESKFGLLIISPEELIIQFDELVNDSAYISQDLIGSDVQISRLIWDQLEKISSNFQPYQNESRKQLQHKINQLISFPDKNQIFVFSGIDNLPLILICIHKEGKNLSIPLLRFANTKFPRNYLSQIIYWIIRSSNSEKLSVISFTEDNYPEFVTSCLKVCDFNYYDGIWTKTNLFMNLTLKEFYELIDLENITVYNNLEKDHYENTNPISNINLAINIEKTYWPLKIDQEEIPVFVIPIKPKWAMDLFDYELGSQTLFGPNNSLILKTENVYYRSAKTKYPTAPSRILWYISRDPQRKFQGTSSIRACSYVDETQIGSPKELFSIYAEMGVYKWKDVIQTSSKFKSKVLIFTFSRTELFQNPIVFRDYQRITGNRSAPIAPIKISNGKFLEFYKLGSMKV